MSGRLGSAHRGFIVLVVAFVASLAAAGCKQPTQCRWNPSASTTPVDVSWTACADNHTRRVVCFRSGADFQCKCTLDHANGATFRVSDVAVMSTRVRATSAANTNCGWSLAP